MKRALLASLLLVCFSLASFSADQKINDRTFRISKNMSVFNSVFRELDAFYVDTLNYDKMMKTAIDQMLGKIDPYTVYMPDLTLCICPRKKLPILLL